jgi:eukaryotic-like serine/threonine-protein kinase
MADQSERVRASLAGRYTIERELGRGGMATVYLATDVKHQRKVAIKVLRPALAAALGADRFLREIEIAARLSHPHILPLYDSGEVGGVLFYVMPYIKGESLRHRLQRERQLAIDEAIGITRQVAAALDHAHAQGLIHRDIKPENILLHEGEAMVADFGIALAINAAAGERLTETGVFVGTTEYMSPEQATGDLTLDARSDVYSLGCVLYEMLAGEPPYTGPTAQAQIAKRLVDPVPAVRRLRAAVPAGVERALGKALARVPADRFTSAGAFAEALVRPDVVQPEPRSVAVLPFLNLSADPENEYFVDGVTEDVIAHLSKIRALKVISRTSVMPFRKRDQGLREIATRLGVETLLEGSVRRVGQRVRIVAQLIDAESDRHLWAETYDRELTDIFAIQSDVALHIAAALETGLSPDERTRIGKAPTNDLEAYHLYLKGRHCALRYTEEGIRQAHEHYELAVAKDATYALAYVGTAFGYVQIGLGHGAGLLSSDDAYRLAGEAVAKALRLDGSLADAHSLLGFLKVTVDFDWTGAEREFKLALDLNPSSAIAYGMYALALSAQERYDEAITMQQRAKELDPLAPVISSDLASTLLRAGRHDEAAQEAKRLLAVEPRFPMGHSTLGWAYLNLGSRDEGFAELERAVALSPGNTIFLAQLGEAYALAGRVQEARDVLRQLEELSRQRYVSPYHMAYVYTGLGEREQAMDLLERAYEARAGGIYGIKGSFLFTPLRSHPRFAALLKRMNLAPT